MKMSAERKMLVKMIRESVSLMCKTSLKYDNKLTIDGILGITLDDEDLFMVKVNQCYINEGSADEELLSVQPQSMSEAEEELPKSPKKKRKKTVSKVIEEEPDLEVTLETPKRKRGRPKKNTPVIPVVKSIQKVKTEPPPLRRVLEAKKTPDEEEALASMDAVEAECDDEGDESMYEDNEPKTDLQKLAAACSDQVQHKLKKEPQTVMMTPEAEYQEEGQTQYVLEDGTIVYETKPMLGDGQYQEMVSVPTVTEQQLVDESGRPTTVMMLVNTHNTSHNTICVTEQTEDDIPLLPTQPETPQSVQEETTVTKQLTPIQIGEGTGPLSCRKCHAKFRYMQGLKRHSKVCPASASVLVHVSPSSPTPQTVSVQFREVEEETEEAANLSCKVCGQTFDSVAVYNGHMNAHYDTRPFTCEHCNKTFNYNSAFTQHKKICQKKPQVYQAVRATVVEQI